MNFKTFAIKFIVFALVFVAADWLVGIAFSALNAIAGDKYERENYIRNEMRADIVVMGSSKATHHYVPAVFEDSLKMTTYNCGQRGNGIIYEYGRLATIYQRYTPKVIIVDVIKGYDFEQNDNSRYLDYLKMDYGANATVDSIFNAVDGWNKYKMLLKSYRYNSTICDMLVNIVLRNRSRFQRDGYYPLTGHLPPEKMEKKIVRHEPYLIDSLKLRCLEQLATEKHEGSIILFTISPTYSWVDMEEYAPIYEISRRTGVPVLDYRNDERFFGKNELFVDGAHLNDTGARIYSAIVAHDVKPYLVEMSKID